MNSSLTLKGIVILVLFGNISCNSNKDKGRLLAIVGEDELYETDVSFLVYSQLDSAEVVSSYVDLWVSERILLNEAEQAEDLDKHTIERTVEEVRNDLLIHQLEKLFS